jgi:hypothetical protein
MVYVYFNSAGRISRASPYQRQKLGPFDFFDPIHDHFAPQSPIFPISAFNFPCRAKAAPRVVPLSSVLTLATADLSSVALAKEDAFWFQLSIVKEQLCRVLISHIILGNASALL